MPRSSGIDSELSIEVFSNFIHLFIETGSEFLNGALQFFYFVFVLAVHGCIGLVGLAASGSGRTNADARSTAFKPRRYEQFL